MAKNAYVVLKLKDQFTKPMSEATKGTKQFEKQCELARKSVAKMANNGMKKITSFGVKAAKVTAGVAAGFASMALASGWSRMTKIDNAKVKLEAIGNTAEDVTKIMDNALASVKGTAYGMDAAATTAASAVAAGIKPGKSLEKYLSSVADAAAVANIEMDEMGSIFNKVATKGKADNEVLTQLSEKGIPIYQYLAKEIGTTSEKVFDMAKDGEIDLKTFQKAVKNNIGGAAKEIGSKTITGAISNLKASISRIGSNFLGSADDSSSFAGQILPLLNKATEAFGKLEEKAKVWGGKFGKKVGDGVAWISENFDTIKKVAKAALPVIAGFYSALLAYNGISKLSKGITAVKKGIDAVRISGGLIKALLSGNPIMLVAIAIGVLVTAFITLYKKSETFRNVVHKLWDILKKVAGFFAKTLIARFNRLKDSVLAVIDAVKTVTSKFKEFFGIGDKDINVNVNDNTDDKANPRRGRDRPSGRHALGTTYFAGGLTGFNEVGPEEAVLPSGTRIIPADKAGKGMGNYHITVNLTVQGNVIGNREYMEQTGRYIADRIQIAMGNV